MNTFTRHINLQTSSLVSSLDIFLPHLKKNRLTIGIAPTYHHAHCSPYSVCCFVKHVESKFPAVLHSMSLARWTRPAHSRIFCQRETTPTALSQQFARNSGSWHVWRGWKARPREGQIQEHDRLETRLNWLETLYASNHSALHMPTLEVFLGYAMLVSVSRTASGILVEGMMASAL